MMKLRDTIYVSDCKSKCRDDNMKFRYNNRKVRESIS